VCALIPAIAGAQQADERDVEFGAGLHYVGPVRFDGVDATEKGFGGATRAVFKSQSDLDSSAGVAVNIGIRLTAMLQAEWSVAFNHTQLSTRLSGDEEAGPTIITEPVTQYLVEGGVRLRRARPSGAGPFATAGIGYLRQLHDGNTLVDTGPAFYVGGGVDFLLNGVRLLGSKTAGIRADVRGLFLGHDLTLDGATHVVPVVGASLFFRF
jgi:hypothetical protein